MKAGVISRLNDRKALKIAQDIAQYLMNNGVDVELETETALSMENPGGHTDLGEMSPDFMVTVGGDGTILRTVMQMQEPGTPILGINKGSRGFLTEVHPNYVNDALDRVLTEDYEIERCIKLSSRHLETGKVFPDSLNEVLLASSMPSKAIDVQIKVNGEPLIDIQSDGVMASTPVGSTAYNLSAGGSILHPEINSVILTAISPYSYFRSIVIPHRDIITLELLKPRSEGMVIIDGRDFTATKPPTTIKVQLSEHVARFIRFKPFYERLKRRLVFKESK
ncbi:MAG: NAD(+)/NADH kinase [Candidatus Bathyarchaeota archaeon]|jgi:NAD+ kinase|nr:NAD(+)/NADH kinase [Candidatus Bathyarchaeota archaeon]